MGGDGRRRVAFTPCWGVVVVSGLAGSPPWSLIVRQPGFMASSVVNALSRRGLTCDLGS